MKNKTFKLLSLLLTILFFSSGCGKENTKDKSLYQIKAKGFFIVGLDDQYPPMGFHNQDSNEIIGFDIDLAKEAARRLGLKVQFKPVICENLINSLNKGDIDVVWNGMAITDERKERIEFSKPYFSSRQIVMVALDSTITTLNMLKGKKIGLQLGSSSETALNNETDLVKQIKEMKKYENNTIALNELVSKKIDAVIINEFVGRWNMAKKPGVYKILTDNLGSEIIGVGMRKNDLTFKEALDKVITEIKSSKAGDEISKKWFGENIFIK